MSCATTRYLLYSSTDPDESKKVRSRANKLFNDSRILLKKIQKRPHLVQIAIAASVCLFILDIINGISELPEGGEFEGLGILWGELAFEGFQAAREGRFSRRQRHRINNNYDVYVCDG